MRKLMSLGHVIGAFFETALAGAPSRKTGSARNLKLVPLRRDHFQEVWGFDRRGRPLTRTIVVCTHVSRTKIYGAMPGQVRYDALDGYEAPPPDARPQGRFNPVSGEPRPAASYRAARRNERRIAA